MLLPSRINDVRHFIALIEELTFHRDPLAVINDITHYLTDLGKAYENAGSVVVTESALDIVLTVKIRIYMALNGSIISKL